MRCGVVAHCPGGVAISLLQPSPNSSDDLAVAVFLDNCTLVHNSVQGEESFQTFGVEESYGWVGKGSVWGEGRGDVGLQCYGAVSFSTVSHAWLEHVLKQVVEAASR